MSKATYIIAAMILGFTVSAQAQFTPSYADEEVEASQQMSSSGGRTSMRTEVPAVRMIPNPWVTMEPTIGYVSSNFSGIEGRNGASVEAVSRMQGGAGILIGRGMWQGETGLFYSQRGAQLKDITNVYTGAKSTYDFTTTYIDIPLMARFSWPHSSRSHFFARAGVIVGILSDAKYDMTTTTVTNSYYNQSYSQNGVDAKNLFNSTDIRGAFGAGYDWKFARRVGLVVQADLQESFSKVNTSDFINSFDVYNFGIVVSAGLSIKM